MTQDDELLRESLAAIRDGAIEPECIAPGPDRAAALECVSRARDALIRTLYDPAQLGVRNLIVAVEHLCCAVEALAGKDE
jgi:hypothetical protein